MSERSTTKLLAGSAASAVLVALGLTLLLGVFSPGSAAPEPTTVTAIPSQSSIAEGPGGRLALTSWTLRKDPSNRGEGLGWAKGSFSGSAVSVPNVVSALPITGPGGVRNYEGSVAWYRTTFQTPTAGAYALHFESANYLARVWVDGHALGSHIGTYLPFEFRRNLAAGSHTLVVRIDWRNPAAQSSAGFHRTWFNFGGLNGEVSVRPLAASELSAPTFQTTLSPDAPNAAQATVRIGVDVRNNGPTRVIAPVGSLQHGSQAIALSFTPQTVAHNQTVTMSSTATVAEPALWSPASPNLYELTLAVGQESSYSAHVGLRQLTWSGNRMYLNGQRLTLHGASIQEDIEGHGDALNAADQNGLVAQLKAIGANAARTQHPLDPALLERLDAAGILVWQGVGPVDGAGNWTSSTPALLREAEQRVRTTVRQAALHPSIIAWNLANEVAGNGHPGGQAQYIETMSQWIHAHDPGRMAAVDIWGDHPPKVAGALYRYVDAVAETDYSGWYDSPMDTPAQVSALIRSRLAAMHKTFAGKVQIISEFGAESNALNATNSPGGYAFQSQLLTNHIKTYEADPTLSGMLVWDLRDFALTPTFAGGSIRRELPHIRLLPGLNQKGLYDYAAKAKPAAAVVAKLYKALPAV
jgi:Glycosyl hydrolases family 2, TIM barrel domain/Glycosyl hydrolases family 2/Glycosyl hydrolases family 2, sugar binding domain